MEVQRLDATIARIRLKRPVKHASHSRTETENLLVRCQLADGTVGWGEGVPRDYVTGETAASSFELLQKTDWPTRLGNWTTFPEAVEAIARLELAKVENDDRQCQGNAARCAVELALLDAYCRHFRQSFGEVVKLVAPELYQPTERVRYSGIILTSKSRKAAIMAALQRLAGFHQLKVKVGVTGANDLKRLKAVRRWAGKGIDLRIDANEAWSLDQAVEQITRLKPFGISSVEQPLAHEQADHLAELRRQVRTPVMLDESLCSQVDAERAVAENWCDLFNIRLSKCGGFIPSLSLAQFARRHNLGYQLGCQVGETAILSAAGRQFATNVREIRYLEGSFDGYLLLDQVADSHLTFGWGGKADAITGPGLGINVREDKVNPLVSAKECLFGQ